MLLLGRGFFWLARDDDRDAAMLPEPAAWPGVVAVVPARDEAATIGETVRGLLAQDYPGAFRLVVVDDRSTDGTGEAALAAAAGDPRLVVLRGGARPPGWTGKLWALEQGLAEARRTAPDWLLFTDADIRHRPDSLRRLVARSLAEGRVLVSLMARLRCERRRTLADPGLHLLLPDALSLPLVEPAGRPHRRGGRRLRAAGPGGLRAGRRPRPDPRRHHR